MNYQDWSKEILGSITERIEKLEATSQLLEKKQISFYERVDRVCKSIEDLTDRLSKQTDRIDRMVDSWNKFHEDFVVTRSENIKDHETFEKRIDRVEGNFSPTLKELRTMEVGREHDVQVKDEGWFISGIKKGWQEWWGKFVMGLIVWWVVWIISKILVGEVSIKTFTGFFGQ